jgi:hypothetical protein
MQAGSHHQSQAHDPTSAVVWSALRRASFAVIGYVTAAGEPRSSGVVYGVDRGRLFIVVDPDSWKARQIADGAEVAVTVPVRRGGLLSLLVPIPPATVSFHARATVHAPGTLDPASIPAGLRALLPRDRRPATMIELLPQGAFVTYGIGVPLRSLANPAVARGHAPVG